MRLSTAVRIGSMTTRQIKGALYDGHNGRCAIGAAYAAAGLSFPQGVPWDDHCMAAFNVSYDVVSMVWRLNDYYDVTREEIADVTEALENLDARDWKKLEIQKEALICH